MGAGHEYEQLTPLATGGMAELLLASRRGAPGFRKLVVIKRVLPAYAADPSFSRMFLREAKIAASLDHPNVVQVYDSGSLDDQTFLAMEYVHGVDLRELARHARASGEVVPLPHLLTIAAGVCTGLHYVHQKHSPRGEPLGLVHRDISPSNVLVSFEGAVKLADFGVAAASAESIATRSGAIKGKLAYMAPEQARGEAIDPRADLFGLGAVLYELSTGERPFRADNDAALLYKVLEAEPTPPSERIPDYPSGLEAVVQRAMAKDPADRYFDAQECLLAVEELALQHGVPLSPARLGSYVMDLCGSRPMPVLSGDATLVMGGPPSQTRVELSPIASNVTRRRTQRSTLWITAATLGLSAGALLTWGATTLWADASASSGAAATTAPSSGGAAAPTEADAGAEPSADGVAPVGGSAGSAEKAEPEPDPFDAQGSGGAPSGEPAAEPEAPKASSKSRRRKKPRGHRKGKGKSKGKTSEPFESPFPP